jgi:hypothetical protein
VRAPAGIGRDARRDQRAQHDPGRAAADRHQERFDQSRAAPSLTDIIAMTAATPRTTPSTLNDVRSL